ncbi:hypothetical protein OIO90_005125 [Microbotryomycetes sp. JL221]|nr:hypothetical protein OIO90_005125 [Microbotryomycetes sp. JL221]
MNTNERRTMKRTRRQSDSVASSESSASSTSAPYDALNHFDAQHDDPPLTKAQKPLSTLNSSMTTWTCEMPPTCSTSTTKQTFHSFQAYESHLKAFHEHVCKAQFSNIPKHSNVTRSKQNQETICGKVFPSQRLLELHLREWHDPVATMKQERGEKIYECFEESCGQRRFRTTKTRRLHLIDKHSYPVNYFFGVVKFGVQDVLKSGGSMLISKSEHDRTVADCREREPESRIDSLAVRKTDATSDDATEVTTRGTDSNAPLSDIETMMGLMALRDLVPRQVSRRTKRDQDRSGLSR